MRDGPVPRTILTSCVSGIGPFFGEGTVNQQLTVDEKSQTTVRIPVNFTYAGVGAAGRALVQNGTVPYRVTGDLTVAAARLRPALDLFEAGEAMMRQPLRREHPDADDVEIERRIVAWLRERPGAVHGDGARRPVSWPRRR